MRDSHKVNRTELREGNDGYVVEGQLEGKLEMCRGYIRSTV